MASKRIENITKDGHETLQHLSDLLHLFHHRNKNQHRRGIWWRHFSIFRKQLAILAAEVKDLRGIPTTHVAKIKKRPKDRQTTKRIEQRLVFWEDIMIPKWQNAFSQICADGRFAVLGMVLLAVLAETCHIAGIIAAFEDLGQSEVDNVLEQFAQEQWRDGNSAKVLSATTATEDMGEAVSRELPGAGTSQGESSVEADVSLVGDGNDLKRRQHELVRPEKKKKRKGNAIDDLFSSLG